MITLEIGRNLQVVLLVLGLALGWWHYSSRRPRL